MKLLFKYLAKDFFSKKTMVLILSLILVFTTFTYFFVHAAIDGNLARLTGMTLSGNQASYLTALKSNQLLIRNITLAMVSIFSLILFLFVRGTLQRNQIQLAQFLSMGFSVEKVLVSYSLLISGLAFISSLVGLVLGYWASDILLSANSQTYLVQNLSKGLSLQSLFTGTLFLSLLMGGLTFLSGRTIPSTDLAIMMKQTEGKTGRPGLMEKLLQKLPLKDKFKFKLSFSQFTTLGLLVIAIVTFSIMFVLSLSLTFSSNRVVESQTTGRYYSYDISYDDYQTEETIQGDDSLPYLKFDVDIQYEGNTIPYQVISFKENSDLMQLLDEKGNVLDPTTGVFLNPELKENYSVQVGDKLDLVVKGQHHQIKVTGFAQNADLKTLYLPSDQAQEILGVHSNTFTGLLTKDYQATDKGKVQSLKDKLASVKRSQTSNQVSAIINQTIGVITGCLLIYLAVFIGFNHNMKTLLIFDLLGYEDGELYRILLNPYILVSNIIFFLTLPIAVYVARSIQIMTSLQTGDYMPFEFNWLTLIYMIVILNLLIFVIRFFFVRKVKRIRANNQQAEFLAEW